MKTLIINNHTKHIDELRKLFQGVVIIDKLDLINHEVSDFESYDLIVLSGGSGNIPSVFHNPENYQFEIDLVKHSAVPVIGVCLGAEIIAHAYDGGLAELPHETKGEKTISLIDTTLKQLLGSDAMNVYEAHHIAIDTLPENFYAMAKSDDGFEIIKHKSKPILGIQFHPEVEPNSKFMEWIHDNIKKEFLESVFVIPWFWKWLPFLSTDMACTMFGNIYFPTVQYDDLCSEFPDIWIQSVLILERIHQKRQKEIGGLYWGIQYIISKKFRLQEELLAIKNQMVFLKNHNKSYDIDRKAKQFASASYLWLSNYEKSRKIIKDLWDSIESKS